MSENRYVTQTDTKGVLKRLHHCRIPNSFIPLGISEVDLGMELDPGLGAPELPVNMGKTTLRSTHNIIPHKTPLQVADDFCVLRQTEEIHTGRHKTLPGIHLYRL